MNKEGASSRRDSVQGEVLKCGHGRGRRCCLIDNIDNIGYIGYVVTMLQPAYNKYKQPVTSCYNIQALKATVYA
jgi:hypothetical protein